MTELDKKTKKIIEFGDFQTPLELTQEICKFLVSMGTNPASIVEPTCGEGTFLLGALDQFGAVKQFMGVEINSEHLDHFTSHLNEKNKERVEVKNEDFFELDWNNIISTLPEPILFLGNPPWVTNAELGVLYSTNLPEKSNFQKHKGFDAITGKSNFDISEWMLIHLLEWLGKRNGGLAILCKTAVARKVLKHAWKNDFHLTDCSIHLIDAKKWFNVSVDACLFVCTTGPTEKVYSCYVYNGLNKDEIIAYVGIHDSELIADIEKYEKWSHLDGKERIRWRSGVKHDCAKVMELAKIDDHYQNGLGEKIKLENEFLYPLYKSSDVANNKVDNPRKWVIATQKYVGEDISSIKKDAPLTWEYLEKHSDKLDARRSSIYKKQPRFSIFGIGEYSYAPWKAAISGLYKKIHFAVIGPLNGKPSMVDDTCYSIACKSEQQAKLLCDFLNSEASVEFLSSLIFWDSKRPITVDVLRRLDLLALAESYGRRSDVESLLETEETVEPSRQKTLACS